jgi:glycosyltransferase involved in cell wall biosynthesis
MQNLVKKNDVVRIAFLGDSLTRWTGGLDFLRLCISGLASVMPAATWDLLLPENTIPQRMFLAAGLMKRRLLVVATRKKMSISPRISSAELDDAMANLNSRVSIIPYSNTSAGLEAVLDRRGSEVLFPCARSLGKFFRHSWIGYIPDLQHKRLPHFFSSKECRQRDRIFSKLLAEACALVVNARSVVNDIEEFYPNHRAKLFALPFCPPVNSEIMDELVDVCRTYSLPDKYFLISNQFWIHKSHETAFAALRLVQDAGHDVYILCTGNTNDYRWPEHFNNLKNMIASSGLEKKVRFLGIIPKRNQLAIMRGSVAVIQPTLFEGGPGGGAMYDAVSTGTPGIVSDLDVNREIDIGIVEFFQAGSAEDLASKMLGVLTDPPKRMSADETFDLLINRQKEFGARLLEVALFVAKQNATQDIHREF